MEPVRLPSANFYITVDPSVLQWAMDRIGTQFRELLESGAQAEGMPNDVYAAGQHLIPFSRNQRGLYGTAAALLVLARSGPSARRIEFVEGLIRYVNERPSIEGALAQTEEDRAFLKVRLLREARTSFKCAELLYALAAAPPAVSGRERLLRSLLDRVQQGRRSEGGWAADLDPGKDHDAFATASIVRGLHAAGVAVSESDLGIVRSDAENSRSVSRYVRTFCLLVLLEVCGPSDDLGKLWRGLFDSLRAELRDRTEANYEFALGNRQDWIRIPWQLYLISSASICRPWDIVFESDIRRLLLDAIGAVDSPDGCGRRCANWRSATSRRHRSSARPRGGPWFPATPRSARG